jgi:DNA mismatch repair ATPase MutL
MADVVTRFFGINKDKDLVRLVTSTVVSGLISRVEMAGGSSWFLLAINGRLVESASIKKVVEQELAAMGRKMGLAILILNLDPTTVDVNVHPTKKEVIFAETEFVLMEVRDAIKNSANVASTVRITTLSQPMKNPLIMTSSQPPEVLSSSQQPVVSQSKKIRTDSRQMGLSQLGKVALKGRNNWVWVGDMSGDWGLVQRGEELLAANVRALALKYLDRDQRKVDEIRQVPVFLDSLEKRDWERLGISIINDGEDELEWFVGLVSLLTLWNAVSDDICEEDEGDNLVVPLAKLSQLYREFERC